MNDQEYIKKEDFYLFESLLDGNHLEDWELLKAQRYLNRLELHLKMRLS